MRNRFLIATRDSAWIEEIYVQDAFAGYLAYTATRENNIEHYNNLMYPSSWGKVNYYKPPLTKEEENKPKPYFFSVHLHSCRKLRKDDDGSHIILMFTLDHLFAGDLKKVIQSKLDYIDWDESASSFYY